MTMSCKLSTGKIIKLHEIKGKIIAGYYMTQPPIENLFMELKDDIIEFIDDLEITYTGDTHDE